MCYRIFGIGLGVDKLSNGIGLSSLRVNYGITYGIDWSGSLEKIGKRYTMTTGMPFLRLLWQRLLGCAIPCSGTITAGPTLRATSAWTSTAALTTTW